MLPFNMRVNLLWCGGKQAAFRNTIHGEGFVFVFVISN